MEFPSKRIISKEILTTEAGERRKKKKKDILIKAVLWSCLKNMHC